MKFGTQKAPESKPKSSKSLLDELSTDPEDDDADSMDSDESVESGSGGVDAMKAFMEASSPEAKAAAMKEFVKSCSEEDY